MKVLAIIGSPKKGNSYKITQQVEKRLKAYATNDNLGKVDLEFDYLFLKDANLELCIGCFACIPYGEDKCPLKDSRADIEKRILASDGITCLLNERNMVNEKLHGPICIHTSPPNIRKPKAHVDSNSGGSWNKINTKSSF